MTGHDIIVVGGSAGSVDVLRQLCAGLPKDLPASIFVVVHVGMQTGDLLPSILTEAGPLPALMAQDGDRFERGRIYVAPSDRHLMLGNGIIRLGSGPRENLSRPAIDPLFRSAALNYGPHVIGVVLSGYLNDGASGLVAVKRCGGLTVVQAPSDASVSEMPLQALESCDVDHKATAAEMAGVLTRLVQEPAGPVLPVAQDIAMEAQVALGRACDSPTLRQFAAPFTHSCPACGGVLSEMYDKEPLRFRCQVGHAYTALCLDREQEAATQEALVVALRTLEARATLLERMAADAQEKGRVRSAADFAARAEEYRRHAEAVRTVLSAEPAASP